MKETSLKRLSVSQPKKDRRAQSTSNSEKEKKKKKKKRERETQINLSIVHLNRSFLNSSRAVAAARLYWHCRRDPHVYSPTIRCSLRRQRLHHRLRNLHRNFYSTTKGQTSIGKDKVNLHIVEIIIGSIFMRQIIVFSFGEFHPIRYLRGFGILQREDNHRIDGRSNASTLMLENGSFCSLSRYFSRLKNVSKKTLVNLHRFKSFKRILFSSSGLTKSSI